MSTPVVSRRPSAALVGLAAAGGPVFTLAWVALGARSPGYDQRADTISALAAVGAATATPMLAAFAVQGAGQLALAAVAGRLRRRAVSTSLVVAGLGTLVAGAVRLPDDGASAAATVHALAAVAAFGGLHAAVLAGTLDRALPRWLRAGGALVLAVAVPHTVWFVLQLDDAGPLFGYAEKAFTTMLLVWTTTLALRARSLAHGSLSARDA